MNPNRSSPRDGLPAGAEDDSEVVRVLDAYLSAIEAGQPADPDKLLADHPALAGPLRAYLEVMNVAGRLAEGSRARPEVMPGDPSTDDSTPPPGSSLLTTLDFGPGPPPHIHLLELVDEREPLVMPRSAEMPHPGGAGLGRYQLQGEIARGGMGAILRGRDVDLGRELAIKVLLESHQGNSEVVRRFVEEAQIGGRLQHPGVVPVYELGTFPDRRPYFAMKLVKGRTLAVLLAERKDRAGRGSPDPALRPTVGLPSAHDDLPRFLGIFEQICQTMAYAHARGVIHRDLKPSNVMVGSFGEVQVMDWGLAKVLLQGGIADEAAAHLVPETIITTVRSGSAGSGSESQAGSVLGTPSYMAPEQARGEVDRIDERADVFGLGAILCEILTGRPPFVGSTREEIRAQAARGELSDALARLEASGVDGDLIGLARDCLAAERDRRPRNAGAVVQRVTAYLAGVQERLKAAELARVEAQTRAEEEIKRRVVADELAREARARAEEERKRRRMTVALAASVLMTAGLAGGGWAYLAALRQERAARVTLALGEVEVLCTEAERAGDDLVRWYAARDAAHAVEGLLADAPDKSTRRRAIALVRDVTQAAAGAENDQKLLARLVDIRSAWADDPDGSTRDAAYEDAFREAGIDIAALPPAEAGTKIKARPTAVSLALAAALDYWAAVRRASRGDQAGARRLTEAARLADPDPWRNRLRELLLTSSSAERLTSLKDLAKSARLEELPAVSLHVLGATLLNMGDSTGAGVVLREGQRLYPGDVWLNYTLAECLERLSRREEAIRYYMAARSLRPETAHALAHALEQKGETDQAIALFKDLVRLGHNEGRHLGCLGVALKSRGRAEEASAVLEAAIAALRAAIRLKPGYSDFHNNLGLALANQGKLEQAIAEYREAMRLKPDYPDAHSNLGVALYNQGKHVEAIAEYREAMRLKPDYPDAHNNLGAALYNQGKHVEAIAEYREAMRLKPDYAAAHSNLGRTLFDQRKLEESIAAYREALRLKPDDAEDHTNLGNALFAQGTLEEAIAEYRRALRLKPGYPEAHYNLGVALKEQGKLDEAIAEYREAVRLKLDYAEAHCNLGHALRQQGHYAEALAELTEGHELGSKNPNWRYPSAQWVRATARLVELDRKLPAILSGQAKPADAAEWLPLAQMCYYKKLHGASARLWAGAFQAQPKLAEDMQAQNRYNAGCAAALAGSGQGKDDPPLDDATKTRWRKQAIDWLKADLAAWSKLLDSGPPQARQSISKTLQHWKADADLAGLRDPAALAKLPENEQKACRALWAEVDALLAKSQGTNPEKGH
ncbi:MAG: tetratricopeptide repeat protein [Isosphaerales bacterium]